MYEHGEKPVKRAKNRKKPLFSLMSFIDKTLILLGKSALVSAKQSVSCFQYTF